MSKIANIASDRIKKYEVLQGSIEVDGVTYGVGDVFYANKIYLYTTNGKHKYKFYGDSIITEFGSDVYIHGEDTPEMRDAKWKAELARREEEYQKQLEPLKKEWMQQFIFKDKVRYIGIFVDGTHVDQIVESGEPHFQWEYLIDVLSKCGLEHGFEKRESEKYISFLQFFFNKKAVLQKEKWTSEDIPDALIEAGVPYCVNNGKLTFYRYNACINPDKHRIIQMNIGCAVNIPSEIQPSVRYLRYYPPCEVGYEWSNYHHFVPDKEDEFDDVWVDDLSNLQTKETKIACVTKSGLVLLFQRLRGKLYQYTLPPDYVLTLLNNK